MRIAALTLCVIALVGCSAIDNVVRTATARTVRFEVWNRTLDDVTLTDANGLKLQVGACDHAVSPSFRVDEVRVATNVAFAFGFGSGGDADTGRQYLVIVAADGESFPTQVLPVALPPCFGHLRV